MSKIGTFELPAFPAKLPNGDAFYEVTNGQIVELPSMGAYATWISNRLVRLLSSFVDPAGLGVVVMEVLFILDAVKDIRRRPDVAFVSAQRWPPDQPPPEEGDWAVVPDLAIEVTSPNDALKNVLKKMEEYFQLGVSQVWIVIPSSRQIYIYESPTTSPRVVNADEELDGGTLLPGFRLPVKSIFERQPPAVPAT